MKSGRLAGLMAGLFLLSPAQTPSTLNPSEPKSMPEKSSILAVGPVQLTLPEGCVPEVFFTFVAGEERLMVTEEPDAASLETIVARRLEGAREVAGESLKVIRNEPVTIGTRPAQVLVAEVEERRNRNATFCLLLLRPEPHRLFELRYEFDARSTGSTQDFEQIVRSIQPKGESRPPSATGSAQGWTSHDVLTALLLAPARLQRATPYSFANAAKHTRWVAAAGVLGGPNGNLDRMIPPEAVSPMLTQLSEDQEVAAHGSGTVTVFSSSDTETGAAGESIVRGEFVLHRRVRLVIRGTGPEAGSLQEDLRRMFQRLALSE
ncbi:MAG TPA: hypothetical protein VG734_03090 [Lacunisphaera sp.]|nr:hypothetical protein [Lacunisphaera sp.]